jgi:hypothetical protein
MGAPEADVPPPDLHPCKFGRIAKSFGRLLHSFWLEVRGSLARDLTL